MTTPATPTDTVAVRREVKDREALDRIAALLMQFTQAAPLTAMAMAPEMEAIAKVVRGTGRPTPLFGSSPAAQPSSAAAPITASVPFTLDEARNTREAVRLFLGIAEQLPDGTLMDDMADDLGRVQQRLSETCRRLTEIVYSAESTEPF